MNINDLNLTDQQKEKLKEGMQTRGTALGECAVCGKVLEIRSNRVQNYCQAHQTQARYIDKRYIGGKVAPLSQELKEKLLRERSR